MWLALPSVVASVTSVSVVFVFRFRVSASFVDLLDFRASPVLVLEKLTHVLLV